MHIFNKNRLIQFFLFCPLYTLFIFGMDTAIIVNQSCLKPEKIISVFDAKKELKMRRSWDNMMPGDIMIMPDNEGILLTERGKVQQLLFKYEPSSLKILIEHPCATKNFPLIAMAQRKDGLIVISAGNYKSKQNNKHLAEYIIWQNERCKTNKLGESIQAITLDHSGRKLAIATQCSVKIIDLKSNQEKEIPFPELCKNNCWIVDIAVDKEGDSIIGVGSDNGLKLTLIEDDNKRDLVMLKHLKSSEIIKKIHYSTQAELLYLTQDGKAKIINMCDLLEPQDENVTTTDFSQVFDYDNVIADSTEYIVTAHWSEKNNKIEVYRKNNSCTEKFILEIPALYNRYDYVGKYGEYTSGIGHIVQIAIRGKRVVVLTTDGNIYLWSLPQGYYICKQSDKEELLKIVEGLRPSEDIKTTEEKNYITAELHRFAITDPEDVKKSKRAFTNKFKIMTRSPSKEGNVEGKRSRETSPTRKKSNENSPRTSVKHSIIDFKKVDGEQI